VSIGRTLPRQSSVRLFLRIILSIVLIMIALQRLAMVVGAIALVLAGAACADSSSPADDRPRIVATTSILGDLVSTIVDGDAVVEVLVPVGADPHDFEPSARQAASLRDAAIVVVNGLGLEAGLSSALEAARADGATLVEVGELIDPIPFGGGAHAHDDDHLDDDDVHGDLDPHFWHDPVRTAEAVPKIVDALVVAAPQLDGPDVRERARQLVSTLLDVDAEVAAILEAVPPQRRYLLTNHDTFGYFADRYGFEVIGAIIPGGDTLASPSASALAELVHEIDEHDLPAIFAENIGSTDLARTLAAESGVEVSVVTLYTGSLGEPGSGADTYSGMLLTNARLIADALAR
jgi:zinc/manganese transport system substrate-binding protein